MAYIILDHRLMFGPHFYYDLVRLSRKPRNLLLRVGYLVALLLAWWLVWESSANFTGHINDFADTAARYTRAMLLFQYALILLLTPMYLAGTIIEEKENHTLELLYQTQLTDSEILLGKFSARVVFLMMLSLSSMPMLAIISLWGGVSLELLGLHFLFSLLLIVLIGCMSLYASVNAHRFVDAMLLAYALVFCIAYFGVFLLPIVFEVGNVSMTVVVASFSGIAVTMLATSAFIYWATLVRFRRLRDMAWMKETRREPPPRPLNPRPRRRRTPKPSDAPSAPVADHALLWKEMRHCRSAGAIPDGLIWAGIAIAGLLATLHAIPYWINPAEFARADSDAMGVFRSFFSLGFGYLIAGVYLLHTFQSTSAIARERENHTLDFLLLLPMGRTEILFWKWLAPWLRNRVMIGAMVAMPIMGMLSGMYSLRTGLLLLVLPWTGLLFINQLGLLLSVLCRTVVIANLWLIGILLAIFLAHLLFWRAFELMMRGYVELLIDIDMRNGLDADSWFVAVLLVIGHQTFIVGGAIVFTLTAMRVFSQNVVRTSASQH